MRYGAFLKTNKNDIRCHKYCGITGPGSAEKGDTVLVFDRQENWNNRNSARSGLLCGSHQAPTISKKEIS